MGHAIATFQPALNVHQFFVGFFEVFRTSTGPSRLVRLCKVLRRYPEYIQFRTPMRLLIAVLARLPMPTRRRTEPRPG
jgi:hypothetical protein